LGVRGSADDEAHQAAAVDETIRVFGSLDILVNNAAINPYFGPFIEADLKVFRKTIRKSTPSAASRGFSTRIAPWMGSTGARF